MLPTHDSGEGAVLWAKLLSEAWQLLAGEPTDGLEAYTPRQETEVPCPAHLLFLAPSPVVPKLSPEGCAGEHQYRAFLTATKLEEGHKNPDIEVQVERTEPVYGLNP